MAEPAINKLIAGLQRFKNQVVGPRREFFHKLSEKHTPSTLFMACSDSRVDPNLICQTEPGELFIMRNVGCIVPPYVPPVADQRVDGEQAAVAFAVDVLGVQDIIVCGHSHCGAMSALAMRTPLDGLPDLSTWLHHSELSLDILEADYPHLVGSERVLACVRINVLVQLDNLRNYPSVVRGLAAARLRLHGWVYEIDTGDVLAYDGTSDRFVPLLPE